MPALEDDGYSSEEDEEEEMEDLVLAAGAMMVLGAEEARISRAEKRKPSRRYLRRPQLLPTPRRDTPWQALYESRDDRAFITTMGIDVNTFHYILRSGFSYEWNHFPIPRPDTNAAGNPRLGRRSLSAEGALGLVYHYLTSAMPDVALQQIFALIPTTVSRYRKWALDILLRILRRIPEARIAWWSSGEECEEDNTLICARHPLLTGAIGSVDGLNILTASSEDPEVENATYNGWLHGHYTSSVLVFSPRGTIKKSVLNAPGSWHDAKVARPIYNLLRDRTPAGYYLVADTAFPRGTNAIAGRIRAPVKGGQRLPADADEREAMLAFDRQLLSYRQTAEWGMRELRGGFGRLRIPLDINDPVGRGDLLEVCVRSLNVRAELVGISEIRTVYMKVWQEAEDEDIWLDFENVLFGELRRRDRVSIFHRVVIEA
ncbi:hypothetical protein K466DRAFT_607376 [Polyporus arcularius HHB13444]|uniref:DDE Tnp4 domain-containing protein n=1 Tax=Polyporus arcularius HHB13444 TaxID=1314778 RepID=A0A5C3NMW9_9APHY|nr:hypothetical protein K466DRAFT_607376 [Polyporus arcularius HHB13444]